MPFPSTPTRSGSFSQSEAYESPHTLRQSEIPAPKAQALPEAHHALPYKSPAFCLDAFQNVPEKETDIKYSGQSGTQ